MANNDIPKLSAVISLDSTTYSYSNSSTPNFQLIIKLSYPTPIAIYKDDLYPSRMLVCEGVTITDLSNGCEVKQVCRRICRFEPPSKVHVPLKEDRLHTLLANTFFTRKRSLNDGRPLQRTNPEYSNGLSYGRDMVGVDGLEAGHRYVLRLSGSATPSWWLVRWWEHGTKVELLNRSDGEALDGRKVEYGRGPHEALRIDWSAAPPVEFECTD